ncbi:unnamed protein product [Cylicocyclus nassatus]|uniref:Uncharacterized protein n=1 Tax=Cylicocyclus nassatus TaxID=53992 RepID=A0AA36GY68_CYLNA|nr:unnamed protein product [Cylicocyclus nassatus]
MQLLFIVFLLLLTQPTNSADVLDWLGNSIKQAKKIATVVLRGTKDGFKKVGATVSNLTNVVSHFNEGYWRKFLGNGTSAWKCGSYKMWPTKVIAKILAQAMCPDVIDDLNEACKIHDDCYDARKKSRKVCDEEFCQALRSAKEYLTPLQRLRCQSPEIFCRAVMHAAHWIGYKDWNQTKPLQNDTRR